MNKNEFEILRYLCENPGDLTQRIIAEGTGYSLGTVNALITSLKDIGYVSEDNVITPLGRQALKPYRVDNAIVLAAGMSTRFVPFSYEK